MLTRDQLLHFDCDTLSTVAALCKGEYHKIGRRLKSSESMIKHLQQTMVKSEHPHDEETSNQSKKTRTDQAEPVEVETQNDKTHGKKTEAQLLQEMHDQEIAVQTEFLATEGKDMLKRLQLLLDLASGHVPCPNSTKECVVDQ